MILQQHLKGITDASLSHWNTQNIAFTSNLAILIAAYPDAEGSITYEIKEIKGEHVPFPLIVIADDAISCQVNSLMEEHFKPISVSLSS